MSQSVAKGEPKEKFCNACSVELPKDGFSKKQWLGSVTKQRRCKSCVESNREIVKTSGLSKKTETCTGRKSGKKKNKLVPPPVSVIDKQWVQAVISNHLIEVKRLCAEGFNLNKPCISYKNEYGQLCPRSAVWYASSDDTHLPLLEVLREAGADINGVQETGIQQEVGIRPIHISAQVGALKILKRLVYWGADLSAVYGEFRFSVAHEAAKFNQVLVLRWLFETNHTFLHKKTLNGYTPAVEALLRGSFDALEVCIELGYDVNDKIIHPGENPHEGINLLDLACMMDDKKGVKWLRKNGAKVTSDSVNHARMGDSFQINKWKRDLDTGMASNLEEKIASVSLKSIKPVARNATVGRTKKSSIATKLLADICVYCGASTPGVKAKPCNGCEMVAYCGKFCQRRHWKGHKPMCEAHRRGEEVQWPDTNLALRLKCAMDEGDFDLIQRLVKEEKFNLEDPINKMSPSHDPMTALQYAVGAPKTGAVMSMARAKACIKLLMELGGDLETTIKSSENGYTALFYAQNVRDIEMMKYLRKMGADINAKDRNGMTLLHSAAFTDLPIDLKIARMVASWDGFDINAQDMKGFTALGLAKVKGNSKMEKLLGDDIGVSGEVDFDENMVKLREMVGHIESGRRSLESVGLDDASYRDLKKGLGL